MKFVENFYLIESRKLYVLLNERVLTVVKHHNILLCFAGNWVADWSRSPFSSAVPLTHSHNNPLDYTPLCCSTNVVVLHSVEKNYNWPLNASLHTAPNEIDIQSSLRFGAVQLLSRIWKVAFWHLHQAGLLHRISTGVITIKLDKAQHDKKAPN